MSAPNQLFDLSGKICYVHCGVCTTILLVSVPCSSRSMVVTVKCGHCTSLLSVNLMQKQEVNLEEVDAGRKALDFHGTSMMTFSESEGEHQNLANPVINKPPGKRQRAPSAYNRFIKEEIRRLKAENPRITHKEAFSAAAKNWAHFPLMHYKDGECCCQEGDRATWSPDAADEEGNIQGNDFRERKAPRHSTYMAKTPFQ